MQTKINGRGIKLTEAIKSYAEDKIGKLDKFYNNIIRANITVGMESHHHQKGEIFFAECRLEIPGNDLFASKTEKTLYKAIDKIRDYLELELKKHKVKTRKKDKRKVRNDKEYTVELV